MKLRTTLFWVTALGLGGPGSPTRAATFVWDGGHASKDRWADAANWSPDGAPPKTGTADLIFTGSTRLTPDANAKWSINSIAFNSGAGAFTIGGSTLTIEGMSVSQAIANTSSQLQTITNAITVAANQTWSATNAALAFTGTVALGSRALTLTGAANTTMTGAISGAGSLTKSGNGTLQLSGTNSYSGGTRLNSGTVSVAADANLGGVAGGLIFDGGTLRTTAGLSSARTIALGTSGGTIDTNGVDVALAGALSGAGGLTKSGAGTLTLTGPNNYTGGTTVAAGTLQGNTTSLQGAITNSAALVFDQASAGTFAGTISGSGSLTKTGAGNLTLTGANSYTGATHLAAGQLSLGANLALAATTTLSISSGATLELGGYSAEVASLSGAGDITIAGGQLTVGGNNASTTFGGTLAGTGVFEKIGTGALVFDRSFNFAGELRLAGGSLTLAGINLTVGTLRISGDTVLDFGNNAATFLTAGNVIIENNAVLTINNWVYLQDYFFASGTFYGLNTGTMKQTPASFDVGGVAPQNRVSFTGFSNNLSHWESFDRQIRPSPEPATYGAILIGAGLALFGWQRLRHRA